MARPTNESKGQPTRRSYCLWLSEEEYLIIRESLSQYRGESKPLGKPLDKPNGKLFSFPNGKPQEESKPNGKLLQDKPNGKLTQGFPNGKLMEDSYPNGKPDSFPNGLLHENKPNGKLLLNKTLGLPKNSLPLGKPKKLLDEDFGEYSDGDFAE